MKMIAWMIGLTLILFGSNAFAESGSNDKSGNNKSSECVKPAPKYGGQCDKSNNGHGNNEDGVDKSNPGKSKKGEDSDPEVDDEKKSGRGK